MKKLTKKTALLLTAVMCANMFTACGTGKKGTCKATAAMSFGTEDGGHRTRYFKGSRVIMNLNYKVTSEDTGDTPVKVVLTIPNVKGIEAKYKDGQDIPSEYNSKKNVTTYELTTNASKNAQMQECVIKFTPVEAGNVTVTLVFDDNVDASYDVKRSFEITDDGIDDFTDYYTYDVDGDGNLVIVYG